MRPKSKVQANREASVEFRRIDDLEPYARNARTHGEEQVERVSASIRRFGFTNPILTVGAGITAGHGRLAAAKAIYAAGETIRLPGGKVLPEGTVPVIDLAALTETQRRAYILADNKLALDAGWDKAILGAEVRDLEVQGVSLDVLGGMNLDAMLAPPKEPGPARWSEPKIAYRMVFDDAVQQEAWFKFVAGLKRKYPDMETVAERVVKFIAEGSYAG